MKENGRIENVSSLDDDSSKRNGYYSRQEKEKSSLIDDSNGEYAVGGNSLDEAYEDNVYRNDLLGKIKRKKDKNKGFLDNSDKTKLLDDELLGITGGTSGSNYEEEKYLADDLFSLDEYKQAGIICKPGKENKYFFDDKEITKREAESMTHKYLKNNKI